MLKFFRERRIAKYTKAATEYFLRKYYIESNNVENKKPAEEPTEKPKDSGVRYSVSGTRLSEFEDDVLYSRRDTVRSDEVRYSLKDTTGSDEDKQPIENISYSLKESKEEDICNSAEETIEKPSGYRRLLCEL